MNAANDSRTAGDDTFAGVTIDVAVVAIDVSARTIDVAGATIEVSGFTIYIPVWKSDVAGATIAFSGATSDLFESHIACSARDDSINVILSQNRSTTAPLRDVATSRFGAPGLSLRA